MMAIDQPTKDLLGFLHKHPEIRMQIHATPDKTLLYAGSLFKPVWKELGKCFLTTVRRLWWTLSRQVVAIWMSPTIALLRKSLVP
jgi:hypothetical protein